MAITKATMQMRRGNEADFDASKLLSGEWAISEDEGRARMGIGSGKAIEMMTVEAFDREVEPLFEEITDAHVGTDGRTYSTLKERLDGENYQLSESIVENYSELKDDLAYRAPSIVCQSIGNAIALDDSSNRPLCGLNLYGKTTQDGTPTPEAPVELVSVGDSGSVGVTISGKNLFYIPSGKTVTKNGVTITAQADGSLLANGTKTATGECNIYNEIRSAIPFVGKTITLRSDRYDIRVQMNVVKEDGKTNYFNVKNGTRTFVIPENATQISWQVSLDDLMSYDNYVVYPYAVFGTEVGPWEPYKAQTLTISTPNGIPGIPVSSGGNYTDSSGQRWICDEVDFSMGVYIRRIGMIDSYNGESVGSVYMSSTGGLDAGAEVLYLIAEPIETALDAETISAYAALNTYKPNTTIYNDADAQMEVNYQADTKLYIDKQFEELRNAIVSIGGNV